MRLTERVIDENGVEHIFTKYVKDNAKLKDKKLCDLEDIEEELGIDLIILFRASKYGIVFRDNETRNIRFAFNVKIDFYDKKLIDINLDEDTEPLYFSFENYGKTWALTKEELK